jgi:hypothetical protein
LSEEGIIFFFDNSAKKCRFTSGRFNVVLNIPESTKLYFEPLEFWKNMPEKWFTSDFLGDVTHGIQTNNAPGTKTVLFTPPYFFVIKIQAVTSNYFSFTGFQKPNSEDTILCMMQYDEERNSLIAEHSPEFLLPYNKELPLSEMLEFTLYDSKKQLVQVADESQLFIVLTLLH